MLHCEIIMLENYSPCKITADIYSTLPREIKEAKQWAVYDRSGALRAGDFFDDSSGAIYIGDLINDRVDSRHLNTAFALGDIDVRDRAFISTANSEFTHLIIQHSATGRNAADYLRTLPETYVVDNATGAFLVIGRLGLFKDLKVPPEYFAVPPVKEGISETVPEIVSSTGPIPESISGLPLPKGLIGELADYIYKSSTRPVPEIALITALGIIAGFAGRAYTVSNTGLNHYFVLLANTGTGKEGIAQGYGRIAKALRATLGNDDEAKMLLASYRNSGDFASGQGLARSLPTSPCSLSIFGEFGLTLGKIHNPRANEAYVSLKRNLLDLYNKSGPHDMHGGMRYSDSEKTLPITYSPAFSFVGETVPQSFFKAINIDSITDGLIPRLTTVEYKGLRPPRNKTAGFAPPSSLVNGLKTLLDFCLEKAPQIGETEPSAVEIKISLAAVKMLDAFDVAMDTLINSNAGAISEIYNRAHLKALKLAGLLAVGKCSWGPFIDEEIADWAIRFTKLETGNMAARFQSGDVGNGINRQDADFMKVLKSFIDKTPEQRSNYKNPKALEKSDYMSRNFLRHSLKEKSSFSDDPRGFDQAIELAIKNAIEAGWIEILNPVEMQPFGKLSTPVYRVNNAEVVKQSGK